MLRAEDALDDDSGGMNDDLTEPCAKPEAHTKMSEAEYEQKKNP